MTRRKPLPSWLPAAACTALCTLLCLLQPMYTDIDNYWVSMVTAGLYGQDHLCLYLHPWLCDALYALGKFLPLADPFTLLMRWALTLAFFLLCLTVSRAGGAGSWTLPALLCMLAVSFNFWSNNYTVQAAFLAMAGMVLLLRRGPEPGMRPLWLLLGTGLFCLGAMVRYQGALLCLPCMALHCAAAVLCAPQRRTALRRTVLALIPLAVCGLVLLAGWQTVRRSAVYAPGVLYDAARQTLGDYPTLPWQAAADQLPGYEAGDFPPLLMDTDRVTGGMLQELAAAMRTTAYPPTAGGFAQAAAQSVRALFTSRKLVFFAAVLFFLALYIAAASPLPVRLEILLGGAGSWLILIALTWRGRAPVRVYECVLYAFLGLLLAVGLPARTSCTHPLLPVWQVLTLCGFVLGLATTDLCLPQTALTARTGVDDSAWQQLYTEPDALYFFETFYYDHWAFNILWQQGKLPSEAFRRHTCPTDAWSYGQLYFLQYLRSLGAANPARSLLERPHTYYYGASPDRLLWYLRTNYAPDAQAVQAGEMNGVPIWQFSAAG